MNKLKMDLKTREGITLISLVVTIIILIILAYISISMILGNNGLLNKAQTASDETKKSQAAETMNLKITNIQISSYAETQQLPNLQYLADKLCEDNEMEYVLTASKEHASLDKIDVTNISSIFTKLKEYPYEFEINSSLQLASIDGVKIATVPSNDDDTIVSMTKAELKKMIQDEIAAATPSTNTGNNYSTTEQVIGTWINGKPTYRYVYEFKNTSTDTYSANTWYTTNIVLNDVETYIKGWISSISSETSYPVSISTSSNNTVNIMSFRSTNFITVGAKLILEYTKTTDTTKID